MAGAAAPPSPGISRSITGAGTPGGDRNSPSAGIPRLQRFAARPASERDTCSASLQRNREVEDSLA